MASLAPQSATCTPSCSLSLDWTPHNEIDTNLRVQQAQHHKGAPSSNFLLAWNNEMQGTSFLQLKRQQLSSKSSGKKSYALWGQGLHTCMSVTAWLLLLKSCTRKISSTQPFFLTFGKYPGKYKLTQPFFCQANTHIPLGIYQQQPDPRTITHVHLHILHSRSLLLHTLLLLFF